MKQKALALALSFVMAISLCSPGTYAEDFPVPPPAACETPEPTPAPSPEPTPAPSPEPTPAPSPEPTPAPSPEPTPAPSPEPTPAPSPEPTPAPTPEPTPAPSPEPTPAPSPEPTPAPSPEPVVTGTSFGQLPPEIQTAILSLVYQKEGLAFPKAPARRAAPAQRAAAETIEAKWFSVWPEGVVTVPAGGIAAGDIAGNSAIPVPEGYTFVGAYFNGVQVLRIGQIQYDADKNGSPETYVYYVTNPDNIDLVAQVLSEGDTIQLRYRENPLPITYTVTGGAAEAADGSVTIQGIPYGSAASGTVTVLPADRPTQVFEGDSYSFRLQIPRGYTAVVSVNGTALSPRLGLSPEYYLYKPAGTHGTILKADPDSSYRLDHTYTVENAQGPQAVTIALTRDTQHTFSAELVSYTDYFGGQVGKHGSRANSYINAPQQAPNWAADQRAWTGDFAGGSLTWQLATTTSGGRWQLDSLQLNGTDITLPFSLNAAETTTLPTGTAVKVSLDYISETQQRYYTVAISSCYEDIVVTGGNLNATTWQEYIPYEFTGVAQFQYLNSAGQWVDGEISQPIAQGTVDPQRQFRFRLLPGYGLPHFALNKSDGLHTPILSHQKMADQDGDGWFTVDFSSDNPNGDKVTINQNDFPVLIVIRAQPIRHKVVYQAGEVADAAPLPLDENVYSLAEGQAAHLLTPLPAPMDPLNQKVFVGWKNGDTVYKRNQNIPITQLAAVWDADQEANIITFTAQWADTQDTEMINYTLEIRRSDLPEGQDTLRAAYFSEAPKDVDVVIDVNAGSLKTWLAENPWFEVDQDKTQLYYESLTNGQTICLYVKEKTTALHYKAVGEGGTVSPALETVAVKSGQPAGSSPAAEEGFWLAGWFLDEACTQPVPAQWVVQGKLTPAKGEADLWQETTYYAKFEPAKAHLTITKTGAEAADQNQSFLFRVTGQGVDLQVVIHGNGSVTIRDLPLGSYTVTENTGWSWRYEPEDTSSQITLTEQGDNTLTISNQRTETSWLNGSAWCDNRWGSGAAANP